MTASRSIPRRILRAVLFAALGWFALTFLCVLALRWIDPATTAFILRDRLHAWYDDDKTYIYRRQWADLEKIGAPMQLAVIAAEDQTFATHWGFDFKSINVALEERDRGRRVRGASTITQQVAKNLFLWPGQSWVRKGIEAYFTVLIEALWPKRRILEVYLNVAEFGRGVYGAEAAAQNYFRMPAARLDYSNAALLAAVLPNPKRLKASAPSFYVRARQQFIVGQMHGLGGSEYLRAL